MQSNHQLTFSQAIALVMGNMIGAGIFMLPATLGKYGALSLLAWLITAIGAVSLACIFAYFGQRFPQVGGPYAFVKKALGRFAAFQVAFGYWVGTWIGNAALAVSFASYIEDSWPTLAATRPQQLIWAVGAVWAATALNMFGMQLAGRLQVVFTFIKLAPLFIIGVGGIPFMRYENFFPLWPADLSIASSLMGTFLLTLFAFIGLESVTIPASQLNDPSRTIMRATVGGTLGAAIIYFWMTAVLLGLLSPQGLSQSIAPFADAARIIFGPWAGQWIGGIVIIAAFATLNGWVLLQGYMPYAAAQDGLFPAVFRKMSSQGTPLFGLLFSSILITFVLLFTYSLEAIEQFTVLISFNTFIILLIYIATVISYFRLFHSMGARILGVIAFIYSLLAVGGADLPALAGGIIVLLIGGMMYSASYGKEDRLK